MRPREVTSGWKKTYEAESGAGARLPVRETGREERTELPGRPSRGEAVVSTAGTAPSALRETDFM